MAFTTTQTLDNVLLRNISFRTTANNAISSTYGLYANGQGQTYWSNTVSPANLSTLSTSLGITYINLSGGLSSVVSTNNTQSTQIANLGVALQSSVSSLVRVDQGLSNSIQSLSNSFFVLSNSLAIDVDNIYNSTVQWVESTLYGYSSFSTFYTDIAAVQSSVNNGLSSLSTALSVQNTSTYNSLTQNYTTAISVATASSIAYTNQQISSLSSVVATGANLSTFSTVITQQLLSTSAGNNKNFSTITGVIASELSTIYTSSIKKLESTMVTNTSNISSLLNLSTNLSTLSYSWISSFVSTSDYYQNLAIYTSISNLSASVSTLWISTGRLTNNFSTFSSMYRTDKNNQSTINAGFQQNLSALQYEFSVMTTSSILAGIYDTFIELEFYTSTLIGSTIATTYIFQSNLYYSTTLQNQSISQTYFNFYVSTLYASTLSTLIPSTIAFTSSLISSLYSTGNVFLYSSLGSTTTGLTIGFISTTSSLTNSINLSSQAVVNSSIVGYLSTPANAALSTFSSQSFAQLSTFSTTGGAQLSTQNSLFSTIYTSTASLYNSTASIYLSISSFYSTTVVQTGILFSSFSTQSFTQLSTQNGLFNSTLTSYGPTLTASINSTNAQVYADTTATANVTLSNIQTSTLTTYNNFVSSLLTEAGSAQLSSLYTVQNLALTGTTFNATMDMGGYRNFNINVYGLVNGSSNYVLNYTSNNISQINFRRGIITINISTVGVAYSNNNSQLHFNVYRWGLPTTVFGNVFPYISNADYTLQYEYTIMNSVIYTNLLNVFPRLATRTPQISSIVRNVVLNGTASSNCFWRGTPVRVSWNNYSFFPFGTVGAPNLNPEVQIDVVVNSVTVGQYYAPFLQSTMTIQAPYLTNQLVPVVPTTVKTYIVGNPNDVATTQFFTILPTFDSVTVTPAGGNFIGGQELVAITDSNRYPLNGLNPNVVFTNVLNYSSFNGDPLYGAPNLVNGLLNSAGARGYTATSITVGASNIPGNFQETSATSGYADFYVNLVGYFAPLNNLQALNSQITVTLSNISNSYTFLATNIVQQVGSLYRLYNTGVAKGSNTFTSGSAAITYKYTPVTAISSFTGYTESSFVGPTSAGTPDPITRAMISPNLTTSMDAVSTLTFYNLIGGPITSNQTAGMSITGSLTFNLSTFASTVTTTSATSAQVFRF